MANYTVDLIKQRTRSYVKGTWYNWKDASLNEKLPFELNANQDPSYAYWDGDQCLACFELKRESLLLGKMTRFTANIRYQNTDKNKSMTIIPSYRLYKADPSGGNTRPGAYPVNNLIDSAINAETVTIAPNGALTRTLVFDNIDVTVNTVYLLIYVYITCQPGGTGKVQILSANSTFTAYGPESTPSISLSTSVTNAENDVTAYIYKRAGRDFTLRIYADSTLLKTVAVNADSLAITAEKDWFRLAGDTESAYLDTEFHLGHFTTTFIVDSTAELRVKAGDAMRPVVDTPEVSIEQPDTPAQIKQRYPNTYIAGVSRAKVSVAIEKGSNAAISSVKCTYAGGSMNLSYNSTTQKWEGTTPGVLTESTAFTVTATDQRGLTGTAVSGQITVVPYTKPAVKILQAYRCNSSGTSTEGGAYYRVKADAILYGEVELLNACDSLTVTYGGEGTVHTLDPGNLSAALGGSMNSNIAYTLTFTVRDRLGFEATKTQVLPGRRRFIRIRSAGNGVSIGIGKDQTVVSSAGTCMLDINIPTGGEGTYASGDEYRKLLPGYLINGMHAASFHDFVSSLNTGVTFNKDFHAIGEHRYELANARAYFYKPADDSAWSGIPSTMVGAQWWGIREVYWWNSDIALVRIIELAPTPGRTWTCLWNSDSWTTWRVLTPTTVT